MSHLNDILDATVAALGGLSPQLNAQDIPVVKRKLPKKEESVDPATQITVCQAEKGKTSTPLYFKRGGPVTKKVTYPIEITLVTPNDADQASNIDGYAALMQDIEHLFSNLAPYSAVGGVYGTACVNNVWLDRNQISNNYDYLSVLVQVTVAESS